MEAELIALITGLIGAALIGLGILMLVASRLGGGEHGGEGRAYGVLLIGPLPILIRGRGSSALILSLVFIAIALIVVVLAILIMIYGFI